MTTVTNTTGPSVSTTTIQGALTGVVPIDLDITLPSSYELATVLGSNYIRLKHNTDLSFLAADTDVLTTPPTSAWSWDNAAKAASATGNPTGAAGNFQIVANGAQRWWSGTETAARMKRTITDWGRGSRAIARISYSGAGANEEGIALMLTDGAGKVHHAGLNYESTAHKARAGILNTKGVLPVTGQTANEAGIWFMIEHHGTYVRAFYDTTVNAAPPHLRSPPGSWTMLSAATDADQMTDATCEIGFTVNGYNQASADHTSKIAYFSYEPSGVPGMLGVNWGTDSTSPAIQLVDDFDLGADSVLDVADLQTALVAAIGNVPGDAATWTFTAIRNAATGASAGTYAAAGSTTIAGSGRYFSLWGKCASDGTQTGSIDLPLTIAFADS